MKMKNASRPRGLWVIVGVVFLVGVSICLILASNHTWGQYVKKSDNDYKALRNDSLKQLAAVKSVNDTKKIAQSLTKSSRELCQPSWLANVRISLVADSRKYQDMCKSRQGKITKVADHIATLHKHLVSEELVGAILKEAGSKLKTIKEGDYAAGKKLWEQVGRDIAQLQVVGSYNDTLKAQQSAIDGIIKSYSELMRADASKKRAAFDNATVDLRDAYGKLAETSVLPEASYQKLAAKLKVSLFAL